MTFQQELASWNPFVRSHEVDRVPETGKIAPSVSHLCFPRSDKSPTVVAFLRHCGCPRSDQKRKVGFQADLQTDAEKMFRLQRSEAEKNNAVHFVAVSHSNQNATNNWLKAIGGACKIEVIIDEERKIYGAYGLGLSSIWHALNPWSMKTVFTLGRTENIWNRPTESGSRWQTAGMFSADENGTVRYAHVAEAADDLGDLKKALESLEQ